MNDSTSIRELIKKLSSSGPYLIQGRVVSLSPVEIRAEGDMGLTIRSGSLIVPSRMNPLQMDESLHIIAFNGGKRYYVLDRV